MKPVATTRVAPADLTARHLGAYVVAEESGGQIAGVLSDVQHCAPALDLTALAADVGIQLLPYQRVYFAHRLDAKPCTTPQRGDAHTHLWLGGQTQVVSHRAGRVYVTAVVVPTDHPGGTP